MPVALMGFAFLAAFLVVLVGIVVGSAYALRAIRRWLEQPLPGAALIDSAVAEQIREASREVWASRGLEPPDDDSMPDDMTESETLAILRRR